MKKRIARILATATLLGALAGVVGGGGSATAAAQCRPVTSVVLVCTDSSQGGNWAAVYSDVVQVLAGVRYGPAKATGTIVSDGFTNKSSGVVLYCDPAESKYHVQIIVSDSVTDRRINRKCQ